jgi:lipopolysaccharide export system permease protein
MKTLHRYVTEEVLKGALWAGGLFIFIILMDRASFIAQTVLGQGVSFKDFSSVLIKSIPSFLGIIIPISFVMSVLLTFLQMGNNNELVALKSCGISLKELSKPVIALGLLFSLLSFFSVMFLAPKSNVAVKKEVEELLKKKVTLNVVPKIFSSNFPGVTFYADKVFPDKGYIFNFMVSIQKKLQLITIFGEKGVLRTKGDSVFLDVINGSAQVVNWEKPQDFKFLSFKSYTVELYRFSHKEQFKAEKYKTLLQLLKEGGRENLTEVFKRLSLSLAPLIVGVIAFSIGVSLPRGALGLGVTLGLGLIVGYYVLYTLSKKLAVKVGAPAVALTPDLIFGGLAVVSYLFAVKEKLKLEVGSRW